MKVYVFGNEDLSDDSSGIKAARKLQGKIKEIKFIFVNPNEDLPFDDEPDVVILDTVAGIKEVTLLSEKDLDKLIVGKSVSVHDWDLGFQLKYLQKLGKLKGFKIIGLPQKGKIDYFLIQSILRKLVAQDMQGS